MQPQKLQASFIERKKLEALDINVIQKNILFLRQKYWLHTPKSAKRLAWKVKTKQSLGKVHAIRDKSGFKHTLTSEILDSFCKYYKSLYSSSTPQKTDIWEFLHKYIPQAHITAER